MHRFTSLFSISLLIAVTLLLSSCASGTSESEGIQANYTLFGTLGKLDARVDLHRDNLDFVGEFEYTSLDKPMIELDGKLNGVMLTLQEYEEDGSLAGTFEGVFNEQSWRGDWSDPAGKTKVPFDFSVQSSNETASSQSSSVFRFPADPGQHLLESPDIINLVSSKYPPLTVGERGWYYCDNEIKFSAKVAGVAYYEQNGSLWAFALLGNTIENDMDCEGEDGSASHVAAGHCDGVLLEMKDGSWQVRDFANEVAGGSGFGDWGSLEGADQFGKENICMLVGSGYMAQGYLSEWISAAGIVNGKIQPLFRLTVGESNEGTLDPEPNCKVTEYTFVPGQGSYYDLVLEKKDCSGDGPAVLEETKTVSSQDGKYAIPEGFEF